MFPEGCVILSNELRYGSEEMFCIVKRKVNVLVLGKCHARKWRLEIPLYLVFSRVRSVTLLTAITHIWANSLMTSDVEII